MDDLQRDLAESHYPLVKQIMEQYELSENDIEDWHGVLSIALCEAAIAYCQDDLVDFGDFARVKMLQALNE